VIALVATQSIYSFESFPLPARSLGRMTMIYRRDNKNKSLEDYEPDGQTPRKKKRQDKLPVSPSDDRKA